MSRTIPDATRRALERSSTPEALLGFLTITHPSLAVPIRLVSDVFNYVYDGETYTGLIFDYVIVTDTEAAPEGRLRVANTDRRIGRLLRRTVDRPKLSLVILSSADFDHSVEPRTPIGTPGVVYRFAHFELTNVEANAIEVSGAVRLHDPSAEPWPFVRATEDRFPGLFR